MNYDLYMSLVKKRRSIREFTGETVNKEDLLKIIEAGRLAPSTFNSQPWEFVVIDDTNIMEKITAVLQAAIEGVSSKDYIIDKNKTFSKAGAFIILYSDSRIRKYAPPHVKNNDTVWNLNLTTTLAASFQQMNLALSSLDLGAMWVSACHKLGVSEEIKQILNLPEYLELFEFMALGYPLNRPKEKNSRSLLEVTHFNKVNKFRTEEELKEYFKKK